MHAKQAAEDCESMFAAWDGFKTTVGVCGVPLTFGILQVTMAEDGEIIYKDCEEEAKPLIKLYHQRAIQLFSGKSAPARPGAIFTVSIIICKSRDGVLGASFRCHCANDDKAFEELFFVPFTVMQESMTAAAMNAFRGRNNKEDTNAWLENVALTGPPGGLTRIGSAALLLRIVKALMAIPAMAPLFGSASAEGLEVKAMTYVGHSLKITIPGVLVQADANVPKAYVSAARHLTVVSSLSTAHPLVEGNSCSHQLSAADLILLLADTGPVLNILAEPGFGGHTGEPKRLRRKWLKFDAVARGPFTYAIEAAAKLDVQQGKENQKQKTADALKLFKLKAAEATRSEEIAQVALRLKNNKNPSKKK